MVVRVHRRRVVQDLDADHLGLGEPVDDHGGGQDQRQQAQRESLPGLERDDGDGHRDQHGRLELEAQQERDDDLPDETATCAQINDIDQAYYTDLGIPPLSRAHRHAIYGRSTRLG